MKPMPLRPVVIVAMLIVFLSGGFLLGVRHGKQLEQARGDAWRAEAHQSADALRRCWDRVPCLGRPDSPEVLRAKDVARMIEP